MPRFLTRAFARPVVRGYNTLTRQGKRPYQDFSTGLLARMIHEDRREFHQGRRDLQPDAGEQYRQCRVLRRAAQPTEAANIPPIADHNRGS